MSTDRRALLHERDASREHLAATVDALGDKLDVKSRAQETMADVRAKAQDESARRAAVLVAAGAVALVGVVLWRRRS